MKRLITLATVLLVGLASVQAAQTDDQQKKKKKKAQTTQAATPAPNLKTSWREFPPNCWDKSRQASLTPRGCCSNTCAAMELNVAVSVPISSWERTFNG